MGFEILDAPPILARVIHVSRDPAVYFAFALAILGTQLLVWSIARHSADIEWWRAIANGLLATVFGSITLAVFAESSLAQIAGVLLGGAFAAWLIGGWLYEMDLWQRIVLALATPAIGTVAMIGGLFIRNTIFGAAGL